MNIRSAHIRDFALTLPWMVCSGLLLGGPELAQGTLFAGFAMLINLVVLHAMTSQLLSDIAEGRSAAPGSFLLLSKFLITAPCFVALAVLLGIEAAILGVGVVVAGSSVNALVQLVRDVELVFPPRLAQES
jgi:hypothetical protein